MIAREIARAPRLAALLNIFAPERRTPFPLAYTQSRRPRRSFRPRAPCVTAIDELLRPPVKSAWLNLVRQYRTNPAISLAQRHGDLVLRRIQPYLIGQPTFISGNRQNRASPLKHRGPLCAKLWSGRRTTIRSCSSVPRAGETAEFSFSDKYPLRVDDHESHEGNGVCLGIEAH